MLPTTPDGSSPPRSTTSARGSTRCPRTAGLPDALLGVDGPDLVAHMCFEHRWAPHVLAGEAMEDVGDRYDGDLLGDDPVQGWDRAAGASRQAWVSTDAHASPVHVSSGGCRWRSTPSRCSWT